MKTIKRFVLRGLYRYYDRLRASVGESFEIASLNGDHDGMEYCDRLYTKYFAKSEKYYAKLKELNAQKEGA